MSETATKADVEKVRKDLRATEKRLDAKIDGVDAEHARLDRAILSGDAALDKRVTARETRRRRA